MRKLWVSTWISILTVALLALAACAPAAPSPAAAPAKPAEKPAAEKSAPQPAAQPAAKAAEKPAEKPMAKAAETPIERPAAKAGFDEKAVAEFYQGKTMRIIVGYSAGGGYDTYARAIAKHLGKYIPGKPNVIVENMPGAGGLLAANHVYNAAPKDGTVTLHVGGSTILKQLSGDKGVEYDAAKFQYLGAPFADRNVLVTTKGSGFTKIEQVFGPNAEEMVLGGISPGSPQDVAAMVLGEVLGAKIRLVSGYGGTSKIRLAAERQEVDGFFNSWESLQATSREQLASGELLVLAQLAEEPIKELTDVPSLLTFAKDDQQKQLIRLATLVPYQFARPFTVAPGVPAEQVQALRAAFEKTLADKEFQEDAQKANLSFEPVKGEKIHELVQEFLGMPADLKAKIAKFLQP